MAELFSISGLSTLLVLILLQAVLGFDNLLYISIESKRVGEEGGKAIGAQHLRPFIREVARCVAARKNVLEGA